MTRHIIAIVGTVVFAAAVEDPESEAMPASFAARQAPALSVESQQALVDQYCLWCHNDVEQAGDMTLSGFDAAHPERSAELAERMIRKLRAGMMPPPGQSRPGASELTALATSLESAIDLAAETRPNPGTRTLQRLNRPEYARSIRELLALDVDVAALLPPEGMGQGFDNMADALTLSPTLMEGYIRAASKISRLAVGDPNAAPVVATYKVPLTSSQMHRVEGAPLGTRGGVSVVHNFPADGQYVFKTTFYDTSTGELFGHKAEGEQIEVSLNGERAALLDIDPRIHVSREGMTIETDPITVKACPHRVSAAFIERMTGPIDDLVRPIQQTLADTEQANGDGITTLPHLQDLGISGPFNATGMSDTPSRREIFKCRPTHPDEELPCATEIVSDLASRAYRRPADEEDLEGLMSFYRAGRADGDFESGLRSTLQAILASPNFVYRFEHEPPDLDPGESFRISDLELASRLSYFLWSTPPDPELLSVAAQGGLDRRAVLEGQVRRMLADPRAETLATRFAGQWLRLQDLEGMHPDPLLYPQFDTTLARSMRRETELLFDSIVREDRNILDFLTADDTFLDERLARHYGIPNISGNRFRRIAVRDPNRRGVLGHGSILTLTSVADRTSPVMRGKWVMEVILGTSPPPPPPNVPELEETEVADGGRLLTLRERLEEHRTNPVCAACHRMIDPIGLALENFDVTGRWRELDSGAVIDAAGELFDGTPVDGPASLRQALMKRSDSVIRNFTENLMTYGLGRRVEYYDMPAIRAIVDEAARHGNRFSSFALGIVGSAAFQLRTAQQSMDGNDHPH